MTEGSKGSFKNLKFQSSKGSFKDLRFKSSKGSFCEKVQMEMLLLGLKVAGGALRP